MTHCVDNFPPLQTESGRSIHTQESGDGGLCSNMEHVWHEMYLRCESLVPVADTGSCVKPIPRVKWSGGRHSHTCDDLSVEESSTHSTTQLPSSDTGKGVEGAPISATPTETLTAEEGLGSAEQVRGGKAQQPSSDNEKSVEGAPISATPTETLTAEDGLGSAEQVRGEKGKEEHLNIKGPLIHPEERNRPQNHRRTCRLNWKLFLAFWVAVAVVHVPVAARRVHVEFITDTVDQNSTCFVCNDTRCPNLLTVCGSDDVLLFQRSKDKAIPACSDIFPPTQKCDVCYPTRGKITIICYGIGEGRIDAEDSDGNTYNTYHDGCPTMKTITGSYSSDPMMNITSSEHQTHNRGRYGAYGAICMFLVVILLCTSYFLFFPFKLCQACRTGTE